MLGRLIVIDCERVSLSASESVYVGGGSTIVNNLLNLSVGESEYARV